MSEEASLWLALLWGNIRQIETGDIMQCCREYIQEYLNIFKYDKCLTFVTSCKDLKINSLKISCMCSDHINPLPTPLRCTPHFPTHPPWWPQFF